MASESKVLKFDIDLSSARQKLQSLANSINFQLFGPSMQRAADVAVAGAVAGGVGYGAYKAVTSDSVPGQFVRGVGNYAKNAGVATRDALGLTPAGPTMNTATGMVFNGGMFTNDPQGYNGRNMSHNKMVYYGRRDQAQRASASVIGSIAGAGTAAVSLGTVRALEMSGAVGAFRNTGGRVAGAATHKGVSGILNRMESKVKATGAFDDDAVTNFFGSKRQSWLEAGEDGMSAASKVGMNAATFAFKYGSTLIATKIASEVTKHAIKGVAAQRNIEDLVQTQSYRITPGNAGNAATGKGFGYGDQRDFARSARRSLRGKLFMRESDFSDIFAGMIESDMLFDTRGVDGLTKKFEEVTSNVKKVARFYEKSLREATKLMGDMQQGGFFNVSDQADMLIRSESVGRLVGLKGEEVVEVGKSGADYASQQGYHRSVGYDTGTTVLMSMTQAEKRMNEGQLNEYLTDIQRYGGRKYTADQISKRLFQASGGQDFQMASYFLFDTETGQLDKEKWNKLMNGEYNWEDMLSGATKKMSNLKNFEDFQLNRSRYMEELNENGQFMRMMKQLIFSRHQAQYGDTFTVDRTLADLGFDSRKLREITRETFAGSDNLTSTVLDNQQSMDEYRDSRFRQLSPRGLGERIKKGVGNYIMESDFAKFFEGIHTGTMEFMDEFTQELTGMEELAVSWDGYKGEFGTADIEKEWEELTGNDVVPIDNVDSIEDFGPEIVKRRLKNALKRDGWFKGGTYHTTGLDKFDDYTEFSGASGEEVYGFFKDKGKYSEMKKLLGTLDKQKKFFGGKVNSIDSMKAFDSLLTGAIGNYSEANQEIARNIATSFYLNKNDVSLEDYLGNLEGVRKSARIVNSNFISESTDQTLTQLAIKSMDKRAFEAVEKYKNGTGSAVERVSGLYNADVAGMFENDEHLQSLLLTGSEVTDRNARQKLEGLKENNAYFKDENTALGRELRSVLNSGEKLAKSDYDQLVATALPGLLMSKSDTLITANHSSEKMKEVMMKDAAEKLTLASDRVLEYLEEQENFDKFMKDGKSGGYDNAMYELLLEIKAKVE